MDSFLRFAARAAIADSGDRDLTGFDRPIDVPEVLSEAARQQLTAFVVDALTRVQADVLDPTTRKDLHERQLGIITGNLIAISAAAKAIADFADPHGPIALDPSPQVEIMLAGGLGYELPHPLTLIGVDGRLSSIRAIDARVGGRLLRVLSPEDRLVLLAASDAVRPATLDRVLAAALLTNGPIDWTALEGKAERGGHGESLRTLMTQVEELRAAPVFEPAGSPPPPRRSPRPRANGTRELWVAGFPSAYGGADTELDHQIDLWRARGVAVHLVPMFGCDEAARVSVLERGCQVHDFEPGIFRDKIVASFCNGGFLEALPSIVETGRPARVIWFNCMTWLFDREKDAHAKGWIDLFGFQSRYQRHMLTPQLEHIGPVRTFPYQPFFNVARVPWRYREWNGTYSVGRISRDDGAKFSEDTWTIFNDVRTPPGLRKKVYVLGYGENAARKIGPPPDGLDCTILAPGEIPADEFYGSIDTLIHKTGGSRENYSRVLVEAYAHGVVPIVERDFGFPEIVVHGETGFMSSDSRAMSEYAGQLAADAALHRRMAENGRRHLEEVLAGADACWRGWEQALDLS